MTTNARTRLMTALQDKEYREAFIEEHISTGVPFQIRAMREAPERKWTQKELGEKAGMAAERICVLEDPNYARFTIVTLLRLAAAFDVGLMVRFVPFSKLAEMELNLSPDDVAVPSFKKEQARKLEVAATATKAITPPQQNEQLQLTQGRVAGAAAWASSARIVGAMLGGAAVLAADEKATRNEAPQEDSYIPLATAVGCR